MRGPGSHPDSPGSAEEPALSLPTVRKRLFAKIDEAFQYPKPTLIEALPAMGKSYGVVKWASTTGNPLTVLTTRHELYGQYEEWAADEFGLKSLRLPTPYKDCPTMREEDGENDEDEAIRKEMWQVYGTGISAAEIHERASHYLDAPLPCQEDGACPYIEALDFVPNEYDLLVGHYLQAHNPNYITNRFVAFDEFPGDAFFFEPTHNAVTRAVTNYLEREPTLPFQNWKELDYNRRAPEHQDEIKEWIDDLGFYDHRDTRNLLQRSPDFHAHAPLMTHAALEFDLLSNEWEYAMLGAGRRAVKSPDDEWTFLLPPNLDEAESVIALDGTPAVTKWRLVLGGGWVVHKHVLQSDAERREYLRDILNIEIVQTEAGTKPYGSGKHVNVKSDAALFEGIREFEGRVPSVITTQNARGMYEDEGVDELIEEPEHYGNLKGSNKLAEERLGAVVGSPHPPEDEAVERWGALDGEPVQRKSENGQTLKGAYLDFGPKGNALFQDVVHSEVLQAVLRFGREEKDGERGARVYVHTSRLPRWVEPEVTVQVRTWSDGMHEVVDAIKNSEKWPDGEWKNGEIADETLIGTRQVCELMKELDEVGYVSSRRGGRGNAYHWSNERLEKFTAHGRLYGVLEDVVIEL